MPLRDITEQTVEQRLVAVTKDGLELKYMKEQAPEFRFAKTSQMY